MNFLITYDIATDSKHGEKRLRRVAKICIGYGQRVQKSVFECQLNELAFAELVRKLGEVVHPAEDNIRIYRVASLNRSNVINLGKEAGVNFSDPMII